MTTEHPQQEQEQDSTSALEKHEQQELVQDETTNGEEAMIGEESSDIFSVFVNSLTGAKLKIQISRVDSTIEIKQLLAECVETCYITNYDLKVGDRVLEDFSDISSYEEIQPDTVITMQPASYDDKGARIHLYRVRELLHAPLDSMYLSGANVENPARTYHYSYPSLSALIPNEPYNDLANALNCDLELVPPNLDQLNSSTSSTTNNNSSSNNNNGSSKSAKKKNKKQQQQQQQQKQEVANQEDSEIIEPTQAELNTPEEYDTRKLFNPDKFSLKSLEHLLALPNTELPKCVNSIVFSGFNPPTGNRKLRGDLFYLEVQTVEGKTCHITSTSEGFYLNGSQGTTFSPNPVNKSQRSHSLVGLLWELSPHFKKEFPKLLAARTRRHPFEVTPVPFPVPRWIDVPPKHSFDANRSEEALFTILGNDPRIQQREWNEEYQSCKELPSGTMDEKLVRDRTLFKIHCDFVDAASRGAKAVVDKALLPINPIDPKPSQVYIQNNIFFSFAVDSKDKLKGNKTAGEVDQHAHANANNDLMGVKAFNEADIRGIHTLATAIVDYKGYRVVAQSIIPGILQGDQGSKHVYGSIDEGKTFATEEKYHALMKEASQKLNIKEHSILDKDCQKHTLCSPSDCKGIVGSDGRFYVLDLIRTTPRDANFEDVPTAILRPELLKHYARYKFSVAMKKKQKEQKADASSQEKDNTSEQQQQQQPDTPILFNPDVLTQHTLAGSEEEVKKDEEQVRDIATYLKDIVIHSFISDASMELGPIDGQYLTEYMHEKGINMRYLGAIATQADQRNMKYLKLLCEQEMVCRVAKHEFAAMLRAASDDKHAKCIEMFLNSLLGNEFSPRVDNKKKKKKAQNLKVVFKLNGSKGPQISAAGLKSQLKTSIEKKFQYVISDEDLALLPKISTLRNFCLKVGLVVACKDYNWNTPTPFDANDILDLTPVIKHSTPKSATAHGLLEIGKQQLAMGQFESAFEFLSQAIVMFQQVKGPMNSQVSSCFSYLATILFHASDLPQSILHQHKSLIINRRVLGVDSAMTCQVHQLLGMLCHHIGQSALALKHFLRARYIFEVTCGFDHPELATIMTNLAMMYQDLGDMTTSISHLKEALRINLAVVRSSFQTANAHHALAVSYGMMLKYREALDHEKQSFGILEHLFGTEDPRTIESSNWIGHFTKLAVKQTKELKAEEARKLPNLPKASSKKIIPDQTSK